MNYKRGMIRVLIVVWIVWLVILTSSMLKEVLTDVGFKNWTSEYVVEQKREECLKTKTEEECRYIFIESSSVVYDGKQEGALREWLILGFMIPVFIVVMMMLGLAAIKWIVNGFRKSG